MLSLAWDTPCGSTYAMLDTPRGMWGSDLITTDLLIARASCHPSPVTPYHTHLSRHTAAAGVTSAQLHAVTQQYTGFAKADRDHSGLVSFEEFAALDCNKGLSPTRLRRIFDSVDVNGDGTLNLEEFSLFRYFLCACVPVCLCACVSPAPPPQGGKSRIVEAGR
jgi:hypothetical protein